jgi:hypothetical protein
MGILLDDLAGRWRRPPGPQTRRGIARFAEELGRLRRDKTDKVAHPGPRLVWVNPNLPPQPRRPRLA